MIYFVFCTSGRITPSEVMRALAGVDSRFCLPPSRFRSIIVPFWRIKDPVALL